jgi:general secretion pathway protein I
MLNHQRGLTLIEVLIALAIVSIALTAVIKATAQNIQSTAYLQKKTIAMWVGQQVLNEARAGVITLTADTEADKQSTNMLGQEWYWQASQANTGNPRIKQISVKVFADDTEAATPVVSMESYLYAQD